MKFEWDENKNSENIAKHKVSFEKAQDAFFDVNRIILEDVKHSVSEKRYFCIGKTDEGILYCLSATWTKTRKLIRCIIKEGGTPYGRKKTL